MSSTSLASVAPSAALPPAVSSVSSTRLADARSPSRQWWATVLWTSSLSIVCAICVGPLWHRQPLAAAGAVLLSTTLLCTGVILWEEAGHRWTATLLLMAGLLWSIGWLEEWGGGPLPLVSTLASPLALALAAWAMFRYPDPDLRSRGEVVFLWVLGVWIVAGQAAFDVTSRPEWSDYPRSSWWLLIHPDRPLRDVIARSTHLGEITFACVFLVLWMLRIRRVGGLDRRLLVPIAIAAPAAGVAGAALPLAQLLMWRGDSLDSIYAVQPALLAVVPGSFLVSVIRRRLANTAVLTLVRQVQRRPTPEAVQEALRTALDDGSLKVSYWAAELLTYVNVAGVPVQPLPGGSDRLVIPISSATGQPLAMIDTDALLRRHAQLLAGAVSAAGMALENAQLQAAVLAQLGQVRAARLQAVQAGVAERRRLERDLHDGAQQRLLALRLALAAADDVSFQASTRAFLQRMRQEIGAALAELRDLARGIHPAVLSQAGLSAAVEAVVERHPADVEAHLPSGRFPAATEETAYFVICEALENASLHAASGRVSIRGHQTDGVLTIEVEDHGHRAADLRLGSGQGGLIDRVRALGGDIMFSQLSDDGSLMVAAIPCG